MPELINWNDAQIGVIYGRGFALQASISDEIDEEMALAIERDLKGRLGNIVGRDVDIEVRATERTPGGNLIVAGYIRIVDRELFDSQADMFANAVVNTVRNVWDNLMQLRTVINQEGKRWLTEVREIAATQR